MSFILKTYEVLVVGFPQWRPYLGRTPGQARAKAWRSYCSYRDCSFREFLTLSSVRRADDIAGLGRPIVVGGEAAHWCGFDGRYVRFVRPHQDIIMSSHPLDVAEVAA